MEPFGENLRRERELRGVTLNELARATKISPRHLRALEESDFSNLPGGVISRGFVRSISRYMNLDEEFWVGEFMEASDERPKMIAYPEPRKTPGAVSTGRRVLTGGLLLALFAAGAVAVHYIEKERARTADTQPDAGNPVAELAPADAPPALPESAAIPADTPRVITVSAKTMTLQIDTPLEDAWVQITADGEIVHEGVMTRKQTLTITASQVIELTTRNASAVFLTLNGETLLEALGYPGETRSLTLRTSSADQPPPRL